MNQSITRNLVFAAMMTALTVICAQIQIPLPMVPISPIGKTMSPSLL